MKHKVLMTTLMAAPLMLSACGGDEPVAESKAAAAYKSNLSQHAIIDAINDYKPADTNLVSVTAFKDKLAEGGVSWSSVSESGGRLVFTDLKRESGTTIEQIELSGLMILNEHAPIAQYVEFTGLKDKDTEIASGALNIPSGAGVDAYIDYVTKDGVAPDIGPKMMDLLLGIVEEFDGGGYLKGVQTLEGETEFVGWMSTPGRATFSVLMEDLTVERSEGYLSPDDFVAFQIETIQLSHFDMTILEGLTPGSPESGLALAMDFYNPFAPVFEAIQITNLSAQSEELGINIPQLDWTMLPGEKGVHSNFLDLKVIYELDEDMLKYAPEGIVERMEELGLWPFFITLSSESVVDNNTDRYKLVNGRQSLSDQFDLDLSFEIDGANEMITGFGESMTKTFSALTVYGTGDARVMAGGISEALATGLKSLTINDLSLTIRDRGFLDKVVKLVAEHDDRDPDSIREQMSSAMTLATLSAQSPYQSELALDYAAAVQSFIQSGGAFQFTVKPEGGLAMVDVYKTIQTHELTRNSNPAAFVDEILKSLNIDFEHIPH